MHGECTLPELFWPKVERSDGCWNWTGTMLRRSPGGPPHYGLLTWRGNNVLAHRASWLIHFGDIPAHKGVRHSCGVGICVRPDHLVLGSYAPNGSNAPRVPCGCGCGTVIAARTRGQDRHFVNGHYMAAGLGVRADLESRFWAKVNKLGRVVRPDLGPCWEWTGTRRLGYGRIRAARGGALLMATHVSWEIATGERVSPNLNACHKCDNPPCVRPDHLFLGTDSDNQKDRSAKGRHPWANGGVRGERNPKARATEEQVREIRRRYQPRVVTARMLAEELGLPFSTVHRIVQNRHWKHVV